jgi:DNA-binding CsgD family transcriptional regulator
MTMKPDRRDRAASTVNLLYRTLEDSRLWEAALTALAEALDADHIVLDLRSSFAEAPEQVLAARVAPSHLEQFSAHPEYSLLRDLVSQTSVTAVMPGEAVIDRRLQARSEFYADVIRPMGGYHSVFAVAAHDGKGYPPLLAACRNAARKPFVEEHWRQLEFLLPHLETVLRLRQRLSALDTERWWYQKVLDALTIGVILLDAQGRPCYVNPMAESLIEKSGALSLSLGHGLTASTPHIDRELKLGIQAALGRQGQSATHPVRVPCPRQRADLWLRIAPLAEGGAAEDDWAAARVVVFCEGPDSRPLDAAQLHHVFGLTPREAALAQALLDGQKLEAAARILGVGRETVRSQLKSLFAKTGTNRQADLVQALGVLQRLSSC